MNATTMNTTPRPAGLIAINAATDAEKAACGATVWWSLHGDVTVEALTDALLTAESKALPPAPPSPEVALRRAVESVAKVLGHLDVHCVKRGEWAIVGKPTENDAHDGVQRQLVYPVDCTAKLVRPEGGGGEKYLVISGRGEDQIRAAYNAAQGILAPADIGNWLVDKVQALGGIPLKDRGGVYFVSNTQLWKWQRIVKALKACTKHVPGELPTMHSDTAVETIMTALTADTQKVCDKIAADIADGTLGTKALATKKDVAAELLARVAQYETLLGAKLDQLRSAIAETEAAVATAALAASSEDGS
jgi:hypothetical protein